MTANRSRRATRKQVESYAEAQTRKASADADLRQMEARKRRGELLERAEVVTNIGGMIITAKTCLRGVGAKLAADIAAETDAAKCGAMIDREIDAALEEISRWRPLAVQTRG